MSQEKAQLIAPIGHFTVPGLNVSGVVTATSFSGNCTGTASSITKGASLVVGVMTASSFVGDVTGNVTGIGSNTDNLDVGIVTATSFAGNFTGIGSGLTGTPNVVAGVVTATKFVGNTPGTVSKLADGTNINVGVITATKFVGNTSGLAGGISAAQNINVGVLTATGGLYGDGSGLTGAGTTAFIRQSVTANSEATSINLNDGNIIYFDQTISDTTVSFANTGTSNDITFIRTLDYTISNATGEVIFDGTGDYLSMPVSNTDFDWGASDSLTIEAFVKMDNITGQTYNSIINRWQGSNYSFGLDIKSNGNLFFYEGNGTGGSNTHESSGVTISTGTYYHIAVVKDGTTGRFFIDGTACGTFTWNQASSNNSQPLHIGNLADGNSYPVDGRISNVRMVNGTALYTSAFTKPSRQLTNVTNTVLLCCQDSSSATVGAVKPGTITANGDATAGATTSASGIFPSSTYGFSSLNLPDSITWNGGSAPTLLGANSYSLTGQVFNLVTYNGGTNWYGYEEVNNDNSQPYQLYMWGYGSEGALAQNSQASYSSPIQVPGTTWANISRRSPKRSYHAAATKTDGTLWIWGWNERGTLGLNNSTSDRRSSPVQVPGTWGKDADLLTANQWTGAIKTDGTLWMWGQNEKGELGQNNTTNYSSPVQVPGTTWSKIDGAEEFGYNLALKTDGTLWSWGYSRTTRGLLGLGDTNRRSSPTQIPGTTGSDVGAGIYSAGAVRTDGTLWVWGHNWAGCLGLNQAHDNTKYSSPKQVPGTTWSKIRSGFYNMAAIKTDGTLWTWGSNADGRDGTNSGQNTDRSSPVQVPGTTWSDVWCGSHGSGAIKTDGTIWSWGYNFQGMLGQNQLNNKVSSPIQIGSSTGWSKFEGGWQAMATKAP